MNIPDLRVTNKAGSIVLLHALTDAGRAWIDEHIPDDAMRFGGGIVVEPRYIDAIANGAMADGLTVE